MNETTYIETLTKFVRENARGKVNIKPGNTNGVPVLHVAYDGRPGHSVTIKNTSDWIEVEGRLAPYEGETGD